MVVAVVTVVCLVGVFFLARDTQFLMPGPLASAHSAIENCNACHTKSGDSKVSWLHGLVAGDRHADSQACLTCHKMPDTAFNPHGASPEVLLQSTERLTKVAATTPAPLSARAQSVASPTDGMVERGLYCTSCHQEHQGSSFKLSKISNEQCRSCHVVKFDSFDGGHPSFDNYPFRRRTKLIFDHAGHFGKHFPEVAKKDQAKLVPESCSTCHTSRDDRRIMAVAPFEKTCTGCHLDQIAGKDRVSGPKGIAFLSLPGLDLKTLKKKNAPVGEWPEASEAELTPFMKVMIGRNARGRALIKTVEGLNLQDLSRANDRQVKAVAQLAWEIKRLYHTLISGKASDVLADLRMDGAAKLSAGLVADLTASIPRDVIVGAHQFWLPNLGSEMAGRPDTSAREQSGGSGGWVTKTTTEAGLIVDSATTSIGGPSAPVPTRTAAASPEGPAAKSDTASPKASGGKEAPAAIEPPRAKGADQTDDLLNPTEDELRASAALLKGGGRSERAGRAETVASAAPERAAAADAPPKADASPRASADTAVVKPQTRVAPEVGIESKVDPESWAEYGGWYRQDYAIFYRPTGHKDKFIYSWLSLTGPRAPKGDKSPAAAVFDALAGKDAQGSCTKCHSVDEIPGKGRAVNFSAPSVDRKEGRFTHFIHEPHFGIMESRGCLTCHELDKGRPYLKSYEQGNPQTFTSGFGAVKKELCQSCHTSSMARQDCLTCHKYHVHGVVTPVMSTKIPTE